jgi:hypothetical protein
MHFYLVISSHIVLLSVQGHVLVSKVQTTPHHLPTIMNTCVFHGMMQTPP